jgi:D-xylonolactonase
MPAPSASSRPAPEPRCLVDCRCILGEGAFWDELAGTLLWVDIYGHMVFEWTAATGATRSWQLPAAVGFVLPRRSGGYVAGLGNDLAYLELPSGQLTILGSPAPDRAGNRFNDGKCDAQGRLWAGTMDDGLQEPTGALYRYDSARAWTTVDDGYVVTNGPTFSPDERTLYEVASITRTIYAFDVDAASGRLSRKRVFHQFTPEFAYPDGLATDVDGCVWAAMSGSSQLVRLTPTGSIDRCLPMPVTRPTSCVFGGPGFSTLFVTSATVMLEPDVLAKEPLAGGVFALDVGVGGLVGNRFVG